MISLVFHSLGVSPDFVNPTAQKEEFVAVSVVTAAAAVIILCTRLYLTLRITRSGWFNDVACVLAIVFSLRYVALIIIV